MSKILKLILVFLCLFSGSFLISKEIDRIPDYEIYVDEIVNVFSKEMKKEFNLICCGEGGSMPYDVESVMIDFIAYRRATIEEARELEVIATEKLLKLINSHEKIRPYLREYPFKTDRTLVAISFRKSNNNYYYDESVAYMIQAKNKIFYRAKKDKQSSYISLAEEPYEEALLKVQNRKLFSK